MLRKSLSQIVSDDPEREREGAFQALMHATRMRDGGYPFSAGDLRDLQRIFGQAFRDTMPSDEFDARLKDGSFDRLQELCGYGDDEDSDEGDRRCYGMVVQVIASFFAEAAQAGLIEPQRAVAEIAKYASLPTGNNAEEVIAAVLRALRAGQRLPVAGERQTSDEEVDQALGNMKDRRGEPMMRRAREAGPTDAEIEEYLDRATDARGRPMFPRSRDER